MHIQANGLDLEVDDQGPASGDPLLLIMGLGMQMVAWPQPFVDALIARGFRVIRFDNRDIGLSQSFDHAGVPSVGKAMMRYALHLPVHSPYSLRDMAHDALGVLDALGIRRAHVCGASMGGMIAQHLAATHPLRVKSLTLLMTSSGARHLPRPHWKVQQVMMHRPPRASQIDEVVAHYERLLQAIGSPAHRGDPAQQRRAIEAMVRRSYRPAGSVRQMLAIAADGDRSAMLPAITAPTAVVHGEDDPLLPAACGKDVARKIPGATLELIPGMGHDLPEALLPRLADAVRQNAQRVVAAAE